MPTPDANDNTTKSSATGEISNVKADSTNKLNTPGIESSANPPSSGSSELADQESDSFFAWGSLAILGGYLATVLYCFWPAIFGQRIFVFRDAAYWYIPTLKWTTNQIADGKLPLWNDFHGMGANWVGQGTTTVFYPGTWLLAIQWFEFENRYAAILACHVLLAGLLCFRCARSLGVGIYPAWFAAISYSLSGPVLVQHANWPFLISAAWFPLAIEGLWRTINHRQITWSASTSIATTSIALAMIVFGGEPQAVYLWILAAGLLIALRWFDNKSFAVRIRRAVGDGTQVASILILTALASLVQLWPMFQVAQNSTRVLHSHPANLYQALTDEIPADSTRWQHAKQGLLDAAEPGSQQSQSLQFSQPPWQWLTLFSGNVLGTWRNVNARWDQHLSAADRVWNPTLYAGIATFLLTFSGLMRSVLRRCKSEATPIDKKTNQLARRWLHTMFLFFGLASLGWYAIGWLILEFRNATRLTGPAQPWGPQVGGLYWLLSWILPGFSQFRYPAKMWLPATLAFSLLASIELKTLLAFHKNKAGKPDSSGELIASDANVNAINLPAITAGFGLLIATVTFGISLLPSFRTWFYQNFMPAEIDPWLGGLNVELAMLEINLALVQSLAGCGLFLGWWWFFSKQNYGGNRQVHLADDRNHQNNASPQLFFHHTRVASRYMGPAIVSLLLFDLLVANGWLLVTTDRSAISVTASIKNIQAELNASEDLLSVAQKRFYYDHNLTMQHRLTEMYRKWEQYWPYQPVEKLNWQTMKSMHGTVAPQFHLLDRFPVANPEFTLPPIGPTLLQQLALSQQRTAPEENREGLWFSYLRSQGIRHWLTIGESPSNSMQPNSKSTTAKKIETQVKVMTLPHTPPPIWISDDWRVVPLPTTKRSAERIRDLEQIWINVDRFCTNQTQVVLDKPLVVPDAALDRSNDSLAILSGEAAALGIISWEFSPESKKAKIDVTDDVIVVFRQYFDSGWTCEIQDQTGETADGHVIPVNRFLTGVHLKPGRYQLALKYRPAWLYLGGMITVLAWCGFASLWIFAWKQSIKLKDKSKGEAI